MCSILFISQTILKYNFIIPQYIITANIVFWKKKAHNTKLYRAVSRKSS